MKTTLRYIASGLIAAAYVLVLVVQLIDQARDQDIRRAIEAFPLVLIVMSLVMPRGAGWPQRTIISLMLVACAVWLWLQFQSTPPDERLTLLGQMSAIPGTAVAVWLFGFAYRRWQAVKSPMTRLIIGTVLLTVVATFGALALVLLAANINWHRALIENWDASIVILYLPLLGAAVGAWYVRKALNRRAAKKQGDDGN